MNKLVLFLASILLPGFAHFLLKYRMKATIIVASYVFHLLFILTLYRHQVLQLPLTNVMILVSICAHYFYSVFDALQLHEYNLTKRKKSIRLKFAFIVIFSWGVLVVLSYFMASLATPLGYYYPYTFILFTIIYLLTHLTSWQWRALYLGRVSVILCLSAYFIIGRSYELLWQQLHINMLILIIVVLLLLESSIFYLLKRLNKLRGYRLHFDVGGLCVVIVFAAIFMLVPKYGHLPSELLKSFHTTNQSLYYYETNEHIKRRIQPVSVAADGQQTKLSIQHRNGLVKLQSYNGDYIKIEPAGYDVTNQEFQRLIEEMNHVEVNVSDEHLIIETVLAQYEQHISKMDIVISIPYHVRMSELDIKLEHGALQLDNVKQFKSLHINGEDVNVNLIESSGDLEVQLKHGDSYVYKHSGQVSIKTRSGHIMLHQILKEINAETLNGNILIMMAVLNQSIYAHAGVGSVQVDIPNVIVYNFFAKSSFGTITVNDVTYYKNISFTTPVTTKEIRIYADQDIVVD